MSTYTHRLPEGYFPKISGAFYSVEDLPPYAPVGTYFKVWRSGHEYYKKTETGYVEVDSVPYEWRHLKIYTEQPYIPERSYYFDKNGEKKFYKSDDSKYIKFCQNDDKSDERIIKSNDGYVNNGGSLRDEFIRSFNNTPITNRGIPNDISDGVREILTTTDPDYGKYCGYDITYATLNDLYTLCNAEIEKCKRIIIEHKNNDKLNEMSKKLDEILLRLSSSKPVHCAEATEFLDVKAMQPPMALRDDIYTNLDDDYYESDEYILEDCFDRINALMTEIGRLEAYSDMFEIYNEDNIRFVYYLA